MINDSMNKVDTFINSVSQIKNIEKIWIVKSTSLNEQAGIKNKNIARDALDKRVLASGKMEYELYEDIAKTSIRVSIPYYEIANQESSLGVISLQLDVSVIKELGMQYFYGILFLLIILIMILLALSKKLINPYFSFYNSFRSNMAEAAKGNFKKMTASSSLSKEMVNITNDYNNIMVFLMKQQVILKKNFKVFLDIKYQMKII